MNLSAPFICRPVATSLMMLGLLVVGLACYRLLPVAALPDVDFPTITVSAALPGASPETMASSVATPLELQFAAIPGLDQMTSVSGLGNTTITLQFYRSRHIDGAATDVQAAINAAAALLPKDLPNPPTYRRVNPTDRAVLIYAVSSDDLPLYKVDDYAYTVLAQKLASAPGVGQVVVAGQQDFAVRIQANPAALGAHGLALEDIRAAIGNATSNLAKGTIEGRTQSFAIDSNDQLFGAAGYRDIIVAFRNGAPIRIRDVADVFDGARLPRTAAWHNGRRAEILLIFRQPGANTTELADRIKELMPRMLTALPQNLRVELMTDRSLAVADELDDVKRSLVLAVALVVMVIFVFLRHLLATVIPAVAVPLALIATFAVMYALGYSLNNLTLMGLTIAVGFVVDDAIVMIENVARHIEQGETPLQAALKGAGEIGFTILSITISLVAVFIPLLLMGGMVGMLFREFAVTVAAAILLSGFVSLTLTPVMCATFLKPRPERPPGRLERLSEGAFDALARGYDRGLVFVLGHQPATLAVTIALVGATGWLYVTIPKSLFPEQDTGFLIGVAEAREDISFARMSDLQGELVATVLADPAVSGVASMAGISPLNPSENNARLLIQLKPFAERDATAQQVIRRLQPRLAAVSDGRLYLQVAQDLTFGGRLSRTEYQYTLTSIDTAALDRWAPLLEERMKALPQLREVVSDRQNVARRVVVEIDRDNASRLGVSVGAIDQTLYDAFGERQVATIYAASTQYKVLLEVSEGFRRDPAALGRLYVPGTGGAQVPLNAVARFVERAAPLTVNHQGQFPAITLSFNLAPGVALGEAVAEVARIRAELGVPVTVDGAFQGTAQAFQDSLSTMPLLVAAAILAVYIVLGMLYESYIHPITVLSALPSAGVGALLALMAFGYDLSVIALIGIVLLIGIVKKNAIMMIDVALVAEREHGRSPAEAIREACLQRFRPIMMTTFAALGGGLPLALGGGAGAELHRPLGIAIVGGLLVSQWLTLYTTPVVYLYLDRLARRLSGRTEGHEAVSATPRP